MLAVTRQGNSGEDSQYRHHYHHLDQRKAWAGAHLYQAHSSTSRGMDCHVRRPWVLAAAAKPTTPPISITLPSLDRLIGDSVAYALGTRVPSVSCMSCRPS